MVTLAKTPSLHQHVSILVVPVIKHGTVGRVVRDDRGAAVDHQRVVLNHEHVRELPLAVAVRDIGIHLDGQRAIRREDEHVRQIIEIIALVGVHHVRARRSIISLPFSFKASTSLR